MTRKTIMQEKLAAAFSPSLLVITDDSAKHAGHAGAHPKGESHFTIQIVAQKFSGLSRLARHRLIHETLADLFHEGLHALAIHAKAPEE